LKELGIQEINALLLTMEAFDHYLRIRFMKHKDLTRAVSIAWVTLANSDTLRKAFSSQTLACR
jgi:hypothetical protein